MDAHDLIAWALRQRPAGTRAVGEHGIVRVLVALCQYASGDLTAWPSVARLADDTSMDSRTVRAALAALAAGGYIEAAAPPRAGRSTHWRILATSRDTPRASEPEDAADLAGNLAGDLAGNLAGNLAGDLAGYPATKGSEGNRMERARAGAPAADARCSRHLGTAEPPPCRGCRDARLAAEASAAADAEAERAHRAAALTTLDPLATEALSRRLGGRYSAEAIRAAAAHEMPDNLPMGLRMLALRDDAADAVARWER